jgi:putative ABC transport system substrate-binding protein
MANLIRRRNVVMLAATAATLPVAWPLAVVAQQSKPPMIGYLDWHAPPPNSPFLEAFRAGLAEAGLIEGRNLLIEYRWANGNLAQLPDMAADLVRRGASIIVTSDASAPILAAKRATSTIPIVFFYGGDPVKQGLVASFNRPDGNVTGITTIVIDLPGKQLDLLLKMVPQARKVGVLSGDRSYIGYEELTTSMLAAGRALGVEIMVVECRSDRDFEMAVAKMVDSGCGAMIVGALALTNLNKVVSLAALHKLPAIYPFRSLVLAGGLMSYVADPVPLFRRLGSAYVARILNGMKPADLPVEQPTKFDLAINLQTAKALGLAVPRTLLVEANELIE